jgi:hypothetical protein
VKDDAEIWAQAETSCVAWHDAKWTGVVEDFAQELATVVPRLLRPKPSTQRTLVVALCASTKGANS